MARLRAKAKPARVMTADLAHDMKRNGSRGAYGRERLRLTEDIVRGIVERARAARVDGRGTDFVDVDTAGLILRATPTAVTWFLKTKVKTVRLGSSHQLGLTGARGLVDLIRHAMLIRETEDVIRERIESYHARFARSGNTFQVEDDAWTSLFDAHPPPRTPAPDGRWTWCDLVDQFLAHKLPTFSGRWATQFEKHLRRSLDRILDAPRPLDELAVKSVKAADLLAVRNHVAEIHTESAAADSVEAMRAALDWAYEYHADKAGLEKVEYPWWRDKVKAAWSSTPREHTPRVEELVKTMLLAEKHRSLGGTAKATSESILAALWAIILTGQRAGALTGTLRKTTRPWPERPGWVIWTWTAKEMKGTKKSARPHALPIPPQAQAMLARFNVDPTSTYLFPSRGGRVTPVGLTQLLDRLKGKEKAGRNGGVTIRPAADLLSQNDIRHWIPHDVRRTLGTHLDLEKLGGAGSAILAHKRRTAKGDPNEERELAQAITLRHYIHSQRLDLKAEGMASWVAAVLEEYEIQKAALD